jgi:hypothetical protein
MKTYEAEVKKCGAQVPEVRVGEIPRDDQVFYTQDQRVADMLASRGVEFKAFLYRPGHMEPAYAYEEAEVRKALTGPYQALADMVTGDDLRAAGLRR